MADGKKYPSLLGKWKSTLQIGNVSVSICLRAILLLTSCSTGYTLAARAEATLATVKDISKDNVTKSTKITDTLQELLAAIEGEQGDTQDEYLAGIALGWIHVVLEEPGIAIARLSEDSIFLNTNLSKSDSIRGWTKVCVVKGAYIRGTGRGYFY